jgi:glycosyltransferase involved in cell wall biosynthesis
LDALALAGIGQSLETSSVTLLTARPTPAAIRLVIPGFAPLDHSSHWFNELLHFRNECLGLGLIPRIIVPRSTEAPVAAEIDADRILDPLPALEVNAGNFVGSTVTFADTASFFAPLRAWLAAECLGSSDIIYFPQGHPILIRGIGGWLSEQPDGKRPAVFFRIIGDELTDLDTGRFKPRAAFYRLASADLKKAPGQERVFFLVNSSAKARAVSRVLCRRPFMMQHHFGRAAGNVPVTDPTSPTVYVHLNARSGQCLANLGETIEQVCAAEPAARFLLKPAGDISQAIAALHLQDRPSVEILPRDMNTADYFKNLARSTLVLLAYEAQPYRVLTSGVFTEAASLGKPVIVPGGTWMAEKMAQGYGVGLSFEDPSARSMAGVILKGIQAAHQLAAAAQEIAPRLAEETGCRRFIETMVALSRTTPDMEPAYQIEDGIDFSDALDSRGFMGEGWGETEPWGAWTIGGRAQLSLRVGARPDGPLFLNAFAHACPARQDKPGLKVRVYCDDETIAEWKFGSTADSSQPRWFSALLPARQHLDEVLELAFEIEGPTSPYAEGLSQDKRLLGIGLYKLSLNKLSLTATPPERASTAAPPHRPGWRFPNVFAAFVKKP